MERAQASVSSGSSAPALINPSIMCSSSSISINNNSQEMTSVSPSVSGSVSASSRQQTLPQISVYGGIPDRQTVQVIQQALRRQPSTAAQYLQQMYAAQQQHLMLQTAALQQQHLSLAAVQQASIVAGRQNCSQSGAASQQALSSQTTLKLASSPAAAAQLITRAQAPNASPVNITQQAVLLGNASTPTFTASQAQMYLRAQMAQQNSLVQVARSLGRAVPLSPQLILTPTATVTTVQPEASSQSVTLQSTSPQMQNLVLCSQQRAVASSSSTPQPQIHGLSVKQSSGGATQVTLPSLPVPHLKSLSSQGQQALKNDVVDASSEPAKMSDGVSEMSAHVISVSHNMSTATNHPLINSAYAQIQTHQLLQQHKQQFVIQQQSQLPQSNIQTQGQALQTVAIQPALANQQCAIPVLPKTPTQQAGIFHSTVSPRMLNGPSPTLNPSKVKQMQLTAVNLHFHPPPTQAGQTALMTQNNSEKDNAFSPAIRDDCLSQSDQQLLSQPTQEPVGIEQCLYDRSYLTVNAEGPDPTVPVPAAAPLCVNGNPAMTSGSGNNAPTVTGSTPHNGHSKTPQAIVKPQILTHVIEGFVIQEGAEPFPVERPSLLLENVKKPKQQQESHSDGEKKVQNSHTADAEMEDLSQQDLKNMQKEPTLSCELCGKVDLALNFKRSKRFCSTVCAKRYNVGCTKRMGLFPRRPPPENLKKQRASTNHHHTTEAKKTVSPSTQTFTAGSAPSPCRSQLCYGESSLCSDTSRYEEPLSPVSVASSGAQWLRKDRGADPGENLGKDLPLLRQPFTPSDPAKWNVEDVYDFICSLPGCQEIAEEFRAQEIDGQALLLLKEDHLMSTMNIKLGPALKIFACISMLKDS